MGINELKENIENSLSHNQFLSMDDRNKISGILEERLFPFFEICNVGYDIDNLNELLSQLSIETIVDNDKLHDMNEIYSYDSEKDKLLFNKNKSFDSDEKQKYMETHDLMYSLLGAMSKNRLETLDESDSDVISKEGLMFEISGIEYGKFLNHKMKERIIELTLGNPEDAIVTLPTIQDEILGDFEKIVGYAKLLEYFINGKGSEFYMNVNEKIGNEKSKEIFGIMNEYETSDPNDMRRIRSIDSKYIISKSEFLQNIDENLLAM